MRKGDSAAWAAVYEQLADRVFQHALYRLAGDREAAEVITQEVFVRASSPSIHTSRQKGTLLGWLRGICRRAIARRYRTRPAGAAPGNAGLVVPDGSGCCCEPVTPAPD